MLRWLTECDQGWPAGMGPLGALSECKIRISDAAEAGFDWLHDNLSGLFDAMALALQFNPRCAMSDDDRTRLEACMRQLDARRQALIRAAFFEGSTYEELARRISSPLGSVKSWIRRGVLQLGGCLEA